MSNNIFDDMAAMHQHYGVDKWVANATPEQLHQFLIFRVNFLKEEFDETFAAVGNKDPEEIVDGLIDLIVIAAGTLDSFGVDGQAAWEEVLRANMSKEIGVKETRPNPLGLPDLVKPDGWLGPCHRSNHGILGKAFNESK